jgi:O-antigen/teichoic acid export membrane protein
MKFIKKSLAHFELDKIISASTFKSISTLMTGTVISAVIPILSAPIMSRLFTTSQYGVLGLYMSISGLIGVIAYSHYTQAIMVAKGDEDAKQIIWFTIFFCAVISIATYLVLFFMGYFSNLLEKSAVGNWVFLIPVSIFFNGINATVLLWANRIKQYKALASNRVIQALSTIVVQIILGITLKNETGLLMGLITGQLVSVVLLLKQFGGTLDTGIGRPVPSRFKDIAIQYKNLLFYSTPSEFINNLINQTPIFLMQKFAGISYVGSYNFTTRFLGLPQQFLSSAIVDVFKQKASFSYNKEGNCEEVYKKTFKFLSLVGIVPFGILMFIAPYLFAFVFGEQWRQAGVFAQFLSIMYFFRFIVSPLSYIYIIAGKLREDFILHLFFLLLTTLSFYIGDKFLHDKIYLILVYSLSYSSVYLIYLFRSFQFSKGNRE